MLEDGVVSRKPSSQFAENSKLKKNRAFNIIRVGSNFFAFGKSVDRKSSALSGWDGRKSSEKEETFKKPGPVNIFMTRLVTCYCAPLICLMLSSFWGSLYSVFKHLNIHLGILCGRWQFFLDCILIIKHLLGRLHRQTHLTIVYGYGHLCKMFGPGRRGGLRWRSEEHGSGPGGERCQDWC